MIAHNSQIELQASGPLTPLYFNHLELSATLYLNGNAISKEITPTQTAKGRKLAVRFPAPENSMSMVEMVVIGKYNPEKNRLEEEKRRKWDDESKRRWEENETQARSVTAMTGGIVKQSYRIFVSR